MAETGGGIDSRWPEWDRGSKSRGLGNRIGGWNGSEEKRGYLNPEGHKAGLSR